MSAPPDPIPGILSTAITAVAALVGAFVGSISRPFAEDAVAKRAEARTAERDQRSRRRDRLDRVDRLLVEASIPRPDPLARRPERVEVSEARKSAMAALTAAAAAVGDPRLSDAVGRIISGDTDAMTDAKYRVGELLREHDEAR